MSEEQENDLIKISPEWAVLAVQEICTSLGIKGVPKLGQILCEIDSLKKSTGQKFGLGFDVYRSTRDGTVVVHVDTDPNHDGESSIPENSAGPQIRIYLNDGDPVWDNPLKTGDAHYCAEEHVDA